MRLADIARYVNGRLYGKEDVHVGGISIDTRTLNAGDLFFALRGERDGHDFLSNAYEKGASGAVVSRLHQDLPLPQIVVADTLAALQILAKKHRLKFNIPVVAITGSNGKTTTKDMVAAVLSTQYQTLKNYGNFNNEIGLPLTLLKLNHSHQAVVVEMAMRGRGQIAQLVEIARPDFGIITNIGSTHIELLGSIKNIAEAKGELLEGLPYTGVAILNGDDSWCRRLGKKFTGETIYYGLEAGNDVRAVNIEQKGWETHFTVHGLGDNSLRYELPLPGLHNVQNALAALTVGYRLGISPVLLRQGLQNVSLSAMRLEVGTGINGSRIINDAYNANPASMAASLQILKEIAAGRAIAVLGDMFELGDYAEQGHREIGRKVADLGVDYLVTVGDLASLIGKEAVVRGMADWRVWHYENMEEAAKALKELLRENDTVLIKGSRGMEMEKIADRLMQAED
ncbi:MAG: UDP-N-acetylmuramoyl-tripeptide--D-alanyl-D-alanine ligase [Thermoanaerobacteraceae bacterium]|nr:UDP-N-acetylmuramoyl-tripeptide--D-alanyl-D-alanine ligase [Thermoanaerobacteraceae bacterium]